MDTPREGQGPPSGAPPAHDWRREYWRRNLRLMAVLLIIWFAVSFGAGILFVEQLNAFTLFGYPVGFWFAQQGSIYTFVLLILVYAVRMDRLDREYGVDENGADDGDDTVAQRELGGPAGGGAGGAGSPAADAGAPDEANAGPSGAGGEQHGEERGKGWQQ